MRPSYLQPSQAFPNVLKTWSGRMDFETLDLNFVKVRFQSSYGITIGRVSEPV